VPEISPAFVITVSPSFNVPFAGKVALTYSPNNGYTGND
jgi:hypothetical protein